MIDHPLPLRTRFSYGIGAVAYGVKDGGFAYFLVMFYSTVIGLEPAWVGTAVLIALIFDALSDPIVGYWSDHTRSRWGRRHPFMYASAIPVAGCYALLWNPPNWSAQGLFFYLLILAILIRTLITAFETPSSAMMPELTRNYDERTRIQAWRSLLGWSGGSLLTVIMFGFLLVPTAQFPVGTLNRQGYETYGYISALVMLAAILISSIGTHSHIPHMQTPSPPTAAGLKGALKQVKDTLFERSFTALFLSSIAGSVATGLTAALTFLMLTYFWEFSSQQIFWWTSLVLVSALIGFVIAPAASARWGKRNAALRLGVLAFSIQPLPILLRLLDLMPANGDPRLFPIVVTINTIDLGLIIGMQAILSSMLADLVEHAELRTGRRSEGVFYSAMTFIRKTNQGIGAFIAGVFLQLVAFPNDSAPDQVPRDTLWHLGAMIVASQWLLWSLMLWSLARYQLNRQQHQQNIARLQRRSDEQFS